jgi:hypothetical protein
MPRRRRRRRSHHIPIPIPLNLKCDILVSKFAFTFNLLVLLHQGPDQFLIALLFFMLGRLRYHCTCDADADEEAFPEQVVTNIVFGLVGLCTS